jgi:hypothetical protein
MAKYDSKLALRDVARRHLHDVEKRVRANSDEIISIGLRRVMVSLSYADELFATLVERAQRGDYGTRRLVVFRDTDIFSEEIIDEALHRRGLASATAGARGLRLLGVKEKRVQQVFQQIERTKRSTTREIAASLRISLAAANKWLAKLVSAQLVRREEVGKGSGRPFEYFSRTPEVVGAGGRVGPG